MADDDAGVPAAADEAGLFGVDVDDEGAGFGLAPRSTCFLSGEPVVDLFAAAADVLDAGVDAFEYRL